MARPPTALRREHAARCEDTPGGERVHPDISNHQRGGYVHSSGERNRCERRRTTDTPRAVERDLDPMKIAEFNS